MSRTNELMKYVSVLQDLSSANFVVNRELQEAVKALHEEMFPKKKKIKIIVFEKDFDGVVKSSDLFHDMLGNPKEFRRSDDDCHFVFENTVVAIVRTGFNFDTRVEKYRGTKFDYVINNTDITALDNF